MTPVTATVAVHNFLVHCAASGHTTTYEEVALAVGLPSSGNALGAALSPILCHIFEWCEENRMPHLTSIVVRKSGADQGLPGVGFWNLFDKAIATEHTPRIQKRGMLSVFHEQVFSLYRGLE